jgi:rhodanese-related sulfurtransferase
MSAPTIELLSPVQVKALLDRSEALLVDVREPQEFAVERIHGALLYPLSTFDAARLPRETAQKIIFHCGIGKRSQAAAEKWLAAGHEKATHMAGGLSAWKDAGLPVLSLSA